MTLDPSAASASLADAVARLAPAVVAVITKHQAASGVLWQDGVIVTSASALWRASQIQLVLPSSEPIGATLRGSDAATDLAALGFDTAAWPGAAAPARGDIDAVRTGDVVLAVGREPSGLVQASFGRIGATGAVGAEWKSRRGGRIDRLVRLDGGLYPGLDGAPVADATGAVLGIASSAFHRLHGIVLPPTTVDRVVAALLAHGRVTQGHLGIAVQPVRAVLEGASVEGLLVSSVADDSAAARAGLLVGDVIVSVAGAPASRLEALREAIAAAAVGSALPLVVSRAGQRVALEAAVGERPSAEEGQHWWQRSHRGRCGR
jgi:S1-C subfamily serine protease